MMGVAIPRRIGCRVQIIPVALLMSLSGACSATLLSAACRGSLNHSTRLRRRQRVGIPVSCSIIRPRNAPPDAAFRPGPPEGDHNPPRAWRNRCRNRLVPGPAGISSRCEHAPLRRPVAQKDVPVMAAYRLSTFETVGEFNPHARHIMKLGSH